jgi:NAD(P)-dependent dehydrogenase (short-subunit alcohol dehydrogenase family)
VARTRPGPAIGFFDLVETNLVGTYRTIRATQPHLAPGPDTRHVVVMSSILAASGVPSYTGYCASKAGLLGLVRALAHELATRTSRSTRLCPGWVATDMAWRGIDALAKSLGTDRAGGLADAMSHVPLGRMSEPEDVAGLVAWLVSATRAACHGSDDRHEQRRVDVGGRSQVSGCSRPLSSENAKIAK